MFAPIALRTPKERLSPYTRWLSLARRLPERLYVMALLPPSMPAVYVCVSPLRYSRSLVRSKKRNCVCGVS